MFIELPCLLVYPVVIWTVLLPGDAAPSAPSSIITLILLAAGIAALAASLLSADRYGM